MSRLDWLALGTIPALILVMAATGVSAQVGGAKTPVPSAEALAEAEKLVRELYGDEYASAKSSTQKQAFAKKLLGEADKTKADPAGYFVVLRVAKDVAVQAGDVTTALEAVKRTLRTFDLDPWPTKVECLRDVGRVARRPSQYAAVAAESLSQLDEALAEDRYETATQLGTMAIASARKAREPSLTKNVVQRMREIQQQKKAFEEYERALERLRESPTDPDANLSAGRYLCLVKGDWEKGIAMLALGGEPDWKALAVRELAGATGAQEMASLGDAWWNLAASTGDPDKQALLARAGSWYQQAVPQLPAGLGKVKIERRLQEIAKLGRPIPAPKARAKPAPRITVPAASDWTDTPTEIEQGRFYEIQAAGRWQGTDGMATGPAGFTPMPYVDQMGRPLKGREPYLGQHPRNSLIGTIGDRPDWTFYIGPGCRLLAPYSGVLRLKINDDPGAAGPRAGEMTVAVKPLDNFTWAGPGGMLDVTARIDTIDDLHVTPKGIYWVHTGGFSRVGLHEGNFPTIVNGTYWWPEWESKKQTALLESPAFFPPEGKTLLIGRVGPGRGTCAITSASGEDVVLTFKSNGMGSVSIRVLCVYR